MPASKFDVADVGQPAAAPGRRAASSRPQAARASPPLGCGLASGGNQSRSDWRAGASPREGPLLSSRRPLVWAFRKLRPEFKAESCIRCFVGTAAARSLPAAKARSSHLAGPLRTVPPQAAARTCAPSAGCGPIFHCGPRGAAGFGLCPAYSSVPAYRLSSS